MQYLSIDLETTGLDPKKHNIIEFAAVLTNTKSKTLVANEPYFHCYVAPPEGGYVGSPVALGMNGEIFKIIGELLKTPAPYRNELVLSPEKVSFAFKKWLEIYKIDLNKHLTCAGKNFASFDKQFIENCLPGFPKIHHRCIDPAMFYLDENDIEIPNTEKCLMRAGLVINITHRALDDARNVIELIRKGLK